MPLPLFRMEKKIPVGVIRKLYLDLMKECLTYLIYSEERNKDTLRYDPLNPMKRPEGLKWPAYAHTMIGMKRLENIQFCIEDVLDRKIKGDFIETGVWRGGATIFMRAILKSYGISDRKVWVADSYEGLPVPNPQEYPADAGNHLHEFSELAVSLEQVKSNFAKYGLLDSQVIFLKGWFRDTLPKAPIKKLAVLRLDGDMYESTMDALSNLYPKLSLGGYAIVDDYGAIAECRKAVHDYRDANNIQDEIKPIDWTEVLLETDPMKRMQSPAPDRGPEYQIIEFVHQILQNDSLLSYTDIWSLAGFTITLNYADRKDAIREIQFDSPPSISEVDSRPGDSSAWRLTDLVPPLIYTKQYKRYFELWSEAGFHITPLPIPPVEIPGFTPNLFILGAAKSGTTTLHRFLSRIPAICMSNPKEPFFFEAEYELGLEHYRRRYFAHWKGEPIIGEARHRNLYLPFIARRIFAVNPDAKLIVSVRNPIERAYSHWWHWYSRDVEDLDFEQAVRNNLERIKSGWRIDLPQEIKAYQQSLDWTGKGIYRSYVDSGYYFEQIAQYLKYFPKEQIKVVLFDNLQQDLYSLLKDLETFIGVEYYHRENFVPENALPSLPEGNRLKKTISPEFRALLQEHYREHNSKLAKFLDIDLSHWQ